MFFTKCRTSSCSLAIFGGRPSPRPVEIACLFACRDRTVVVWSFLNLLSCFAAPVHNFVWNMLQPSRTNIYKNQLSTFFLSYYVAPKISKLWHCVLCESQIFGFPICTFLHFHLTPYQQTNFFFTFAKEVIFTLCLLLAKSKIFASLFVVLFYFYVNLI